MNKEHSGSKARLQLLLAEIVRPLNPAPELELILLLQTGQSHRTLHCYLLIYHSAGEHNGLQRVHGKNET